MYKNYSDADLIRAYSTMMENTGSIPKDLEKVMTDRGGIDFFKRILALRKSHPEEINRITKEVQGLTDQYSNAEFVRTFISSDHMSKEDLDLYVTRLHDEYRDSLADQAITKDTVLKSLFGLLAGSIASGLFWWLMMIIFHKPFYFILPVVYFIGYIIIKALTKQSSRNTIVLVCSLGAMILGILIGHFLYMFMT